MENKDFRKIAAASILSLAREIGADYDYAHGWIKEAAKIMGICPHYLSRLNKGTRETVGLVVIQQLCTKTGCEVSDLFPAMRGYVPAKSKSRIHLRKHSGKRL